MRQRAGPIAEAGAEVAVIGFWPAEAMGEYRREAGLDGPPFACLVDPARRAYAAYGLQRLSTRQALGLPALAAYGRIILSPRHVIWRAPREDPLQAGGDFVVGPDGVLRLVHPGRHPADRPAVGELLAALSGTASSGGAGPSGRGSPP